MIKAYVITDDEELITSEIINSLINNHIKVLYSSHAQCKSQNLNIDEISSINECNIVMVFCNKFTNDMAIEIGFAIAFEKKIVVFSDFVTELPSLLNKYAIISSYKCLKSSPNNLFEILLDQPKFGKKILSNQLLKLYEKNKEIVNQIDGKDFEEMTYQLLIKFTRNVDREKINNEGYDMILKNDNSDIIIEAKKLNKNSKVTIDYIQQFLGVLNALNKDKGIFISNVEFTRSALEFGNMLDGKIMLYTFNQFYSALHNKSINLNFGNNNSSRFQNSLQKKFLQEYLK
jgi:HJR/Mrr/RecB family endonuclease